MSAAERAVVAHVLERGYLSPEALASLEAEGPAEDFLRRLATALPARRDELRAAWQRALDDAPTLPPPSGALGPGADAPTLSPGPSVLGPVPSPSSPAHRSEPLPAVGERVGPYAVESVLGRGGMGVVYAARHTVSGRRVALKMLAADRVDDPSALERFAREAEATARLRHPGLVAVHERGEHRGNPWFAMELVDGRSLDRVLAEEGPLEVASACALARQCAEAVDAAHRAGVLHRDLKPANLLLTADGRVRVTDFGLARLTTASRASLTRTGEAVGTPAYMSPEQAEGDGRAVDERADVYGLGATLYALLTGRPPFQGSNALAVLNQVFSRAPDPPSRHRPEVPPELDAVVLRCLEKEPVHRYRSCAELAEELERLLRGEAVDARSVPALARRWRALGSRRQRALRLLALSLSLCVLVTAAGWLLLSLGSPRRFEEALGAELPLGHSLAPNALARLRSYAQRPFVAWLGGGDAERTRAGLALVEGLSALERGDEAAALDALRRYEALRLALDARKQVPLTAERVAHRALRGAVAALAARGERDVPRGDLLAAREDLEAALREGLYLRGPANLPLLHALVLARLGDPRFAGDALEAFEDSFAASAGGDESSAHPRLQDLDAPALRALAWAAAQTGEKHRHAAAVEGLLARGALEGPDLAAYLSLLEPVEASRWLDEHAPPGERPWSLRRRKPSPSAPATDRPGVRGPWPTRLAGAEALRPLAARLLRQAVPDPAGADALELAARREAFVGLLDLQEGERRRASLRVACWLGAEHAAAVRRALAAGPRSVEDAASSQTVAFDELLETLAAFAPKGPHGENSELVAVLNLVHGNLLGRPAALASLLPYFEASLAEGCRGEVGPSLRCLAADAYLALASEGGSPKERRKLCRKRCRELLAPLRARSSHPLPKERRSVARALSVLGRSYWQEGRYREAFAAFEHAESLDPLVRGLPGHLRARAESLDRTGRGEAALRAFEDYLENFDVVTPGVVHAAERCYAFWRASKDRASVRRCGERVLERSPRSALAHRWRCRLALLELEDYRARNGAPNPEGSVAPWGSPEGNAARKYLAEAQRGFTTLMAKARSDAQRRAAAAELRRTTRALRLLNRGSPEVFEALERLCAPTEGP